MKTTQNKNTIETAANDEYYQSKWINEKITEETTPVQKSVSKILNGADQKTSFEKEIEGQSIEIELVRELWKRTDVPKGAILSSQLKMLWLNYENWNQNEKLEPANDTTNTTFWAPYMTTSLWWWDFAKAA
jgi:hypothetical protein